MMLKQSLWIIGFFFFGKVYCTNDESNPTSVYVVEGGEAVLQCEFGSSGLNWYVDNGDKWNVIASGGDVTNSSKYLASKNQSGLYYRLLHILNVEVSDLKKYRCEKKVHAVIQYFYLLLIFIEQPTSLSIENITSGNNRLLGTENQDLTVSCKAVGGKPAPNVVLIIDGQTLASHAQTAQHTLTTINRSYDRKTVACQASHADYSHISLTDSAEIYLKLKPLTPTITGNVDSIEETKPLDVTCTTTGSRPKATLQWTIGQKDVTTDATERSNHIASDTYTVISDLTYSVGKSDNGKVLMCKAVNVAALSGVQTSITLNVKYAPTVTVNDTTYDQNEATRTVACVPVGNPQSYTYYKWQHKSKYGVLIRELDGGQNGVLTLPNIPVEDRYQDNGEYVCTAGNGIEDRNGKVEQIGSGYVIINAPPIFTNDNRLTQYGEFNKIVDVNVYVYSIPKYTTPRWYIGNTPVSSSTKYVMSERASIVNDTFHGKDVQLDGYSVMLTVKNLQEADFNVSYRLQLLYDASQTVQYTVLLESASPPQTPTNFTLVSSTDTSIVVEWIPGYNGGHEQTFNIQYRNESKIWMTQEIPQYNKQTYTLSGLQSNTLYELRMFAKNKLDRSNFTDIQSILTVSSIEKESQTGAIIGGVAGGLIGVILLLLLLAAVFYFRAKQDKNKPSKRNSSEVEDGLKQNILYDSSEMEGLQKNVLYQSAGADYKPPAPNAEYAEVVKIPKKPSTSSTSEYAEVQKPSDVYAQVDPKTQQKNLKAKKQKDKKEKPKKGGKPKGKALNNNAFAELPLKNINDGEYANAEDLSGPSNSKKTTQGLEYADLSFARIPRKGQKPKIHGADERTVYSDVDHTKRAPPLPEENPYEETNVGQV